MTTTALARTSMRVLMIEDQDPDAKIVRRSLASHYGTRIELDLARTLAEGIRLLSEREFDAVLLDLTLPDAFHLEGVRHIQEHDEEMPILVVTGLDDPQTAQDALAAGAQDYLIKGQWTGNHLAHAILYAVERKATENRLRHAAFHDELTGLPNRRFLIRRLRLRQQFEVESSFGLLLVGIDAFHVVNESLGHERGDLLLAEVARRLGDLVASRGTLARWAGDQFACLVEELPGIEDARELAERLHSSVNAAFDLTGHSTFATVSIGIAMADGAANGKQESLLLQQAASALSRAKRSGRGSTAVYDADMHTESLKRLRLESALRSAPLAEFVVHYQPIVHMQDGELAGFEALVRWCRGAGDMVMPGEFLAAAEECGALRAIHEKVLRDACEFCAALPSTLSVSVNLSHSCFYAPTMIDGVRAVLAETGLAPGRLVLEITEGVLLDESSTESILAGLRGLGVQVHLDDFGTDRSSLTSLRRFSLDGIKIDRSFLKDAQGRGFSVARSILFMAAELGLEVVAEGIEATETADALRGLSCGYGQGYLYGRPMTDRQARERAAGAIRS